MMGSRSTEVNMFFFRCEEDTWIGEVIEISSYKAALWGRVSI